MSKKERLVAAIENGTVIDHIPAEKAYAVANLLGLQTLSNPVTIGYNYPSKKLGKKGIIKVENKFFTDEEISRLSVVAPNVVLNVIRDYEVVQACNEAAPQVAMVFTGQRSFKHSKVQQPQVYHKQRTDADHLPCDRQGSRHYQVPLLRQGAEY